MATDDRRMHGGNTPGMVPGRGHERHEEPVRLGQPEPGADPLPPEDGPTRDLKRDLESGDDQESALGGHVATRSATTPTPDDDKA